ncbi:MAG: MarR family transcriptional regulator [Candidatus Paceibacterota bacterium]|jgi:DNA-binding MarR family transcriptional regulator
MVQNRKNLLKNTDDLIEAFDKISKVFASMESFTDGISLSKPEILALELISNKEGVIMSETADELDISFSMATKIADFLVEKKLVVRNSNSEDRRIVELALTEAGKNIVLEYKKQKKIYFGKMLELLSENEQKVFIKVLEKIAKAMRQDK